LTVDDLRRVLSRPADAKKLARLEELLFMQEDIKRARAQIPGNDMTKDQYGNI
jgi:transcription initiation factor TFIID subunit 13